MCYHSYFIFLLEKQFYFSFFTMTIRASMKLVYTIASTKQCHIIFFFIKVLKNIYKYWNSGSGPSSQGQLKAKTGFIILIYYYVSFVNHSNVPAVHEISILLKQKYWDSLQGHFKVKISCLTTIRNILINLLNIATVASCWFNLFLNTLTFGDAYLRITLKAETLQSFSKTGTWSTGIKLFISEAKFA